MVDHGSDGNADNAIAVPTFDVGNSWDDAVDTVAVKVSGVTKHNNSNSPSESSYWVGVGIPTLEGTGVTYAWDDKELPETAESLNYRANTRTDEQGHTTFYFGQESQEAWTTKNKGYISVKSGSEVTATYKITFDVTVGNAITASAAANGAYEVTVGGEKVNAAAEGEELTVTATPNPGYTFSGISVTPKGGTQELIEASGNIATFKMPGKDVTIEANFKAIDYTVSAPANAVGYKVTPGAEKYNISASATATFTPLSGYTFNWAPSTDTTVDSAKNYYTKSGETYTKVDSPTGNPSTGSYYEVTLPVLTDGNDQAVNVTSWTLKDSEIVATFNMPAADVSASATVATTATKDKNPDWTVSLTGMTFTGAELIDQLPAKASVTSSKDNGSYGSQYFTFTFWEDEACETKSLKSLKNAGTYYVKAVANSTFKGKNAAGVDVSYEGQYTTGSFTVAKAKMSAVTFKDSAHTAAVSADKISEDFGAFTGNANTITWMGKGSDTATAPSAVGEVLPILNDGYTLVEGTDFTVTDFKSITDPGSKDVTLTAAGKNFEGSAKIKATVATSTFVTNNSGSDKNLKVRTSAMKAADAVSPTTEASGKGFTASANLTSNTANAVPFGDSASPLVVMYGNATSGTELKAVTDYSVSYKLVGKRNATGTIVNETVEHEATQAAPTDKGIYEATIKAVNDQRFDRASDAGVASDTLVVTFEIGGGDLTDVAASFEVAAGTYLAGQPVVPEKASVKFLDKDGNDVTSKVGTKNFDFEFAAAGACDTWTSSDEKVQGYTNKKTAKTVTLNKGKDANPFGLEDGTYPQGAGDYKVTIKGANNYGSAKTLTGKFTVNAGAATVGSALGNIAVTWPAAAYKGGEAIEYAPKIQMVTAIDKETGEATMTDLPETDYVVSYAQNGKEAELAEIGDYDATIEFDKNMKGDDIIGKVTVGQGKIDGLLSGFTMKSYSYTGNAIDAEIDSFVAKAEGADTKVGAGDYDYTLAFANGTGKVGTDGKPLTAGTYRVTATFTGNYTGTLVGSLTVGKLDLSKAGADFVVLFEQADGTYDDIYSTTLPASGKAEPAYRLAVKDGKQYTDERTLVNPAVVKATYSNNTAASTTSSKAKMTLSAESEYTENVTGTHKGAEFIITASTFEAAKAALELSKSSAKFGAADADKFTVKVSGAGIGTLTSGTNYQVAVRNSKGETVATAASGSTEPEITLPVVDADTYTVVVSTGTDCTYGGLLKATYEVKKLNMKDMTIELTTVTAAKGTTAAAAEVAGFYDKWAIDWAPDAKGIEFTPADKTLAATDEPGAYLTVRTGGNAGKYLTYGEDAEWTAEYADNKDAGTATITVKGIGNYEGEMTKTFTINQLELPVYDAATKAAGFAIEFTDENVAKKGLAYTGKALEPAFKVVYKDENGTVVKATKLTDDYAPVYADNVDVYYARTVDSEPSANAVAVVKVDGNYKGELTQPFLITPADFAKATAKAAEGAKYTGEAVNPAITVTVDGNELAAGEKTFTVEYPAASINAGDYEATVAPAFHGNFAGADKKVAYTIAKADSSITVAGKTATYNGNPVSVEAKATGTSKAPVVKYYSDEKATIALPSAPVNAGTYYAKATAEADDNYAAAESAVVKIQINRAASTVKVADVKATYNGKAVAAKAAATGSKGAVTVKYFSDKAATKAISAPVNAGTYYAKATVAADANYAAAESAVATITIAKAANPVKVTVAKKTFKAKTSKKTVLKAKKVFKVANNKGGKVTYKKANKAGAKKITVSKKGKVTIKKGLKAGVYKVKVKATVAAKGNYNAATKSVVVKVKVAKK